jgi:hypothetical protein
MQMSPVMATVILVVVAVTMALVVSYYAFNLVSSVTRFERLEVYGARMTDSRTIAFRVRNPGVEVSRLSALTVQGRPAASAAGEVVLRPGDEVSCEVVLSESPPPGIVIEVGVITSTGKRFFTMLQAVEGSGVSGEFAVNFGVRRLYGQRFRICQFWRGFCWQFGKCVDDETPYHSFVVEERINYWIAR